MKTVPISLDVLHEVIEALASASQACDHDLPQTSVVLGDLAAKLDEIVDASMFEGSRLALN